VTIRRFSTIKKSRTLDESMSTLATEQQHRLRQQMKESDEYEQRLSTLPISDAEKELLRIVDRLRDAIAYGADVSRCTRDALQLWDRRLSRQLKEWLVLIAVECACAEGRPKTMNASSGPDAFESAANSLCQEGYMKRVLSAEHMRKLYYDAKRKWPQLLPLLAKTRQPHT
jgi:hypothetical protein